MSFGSMEEVDQWVAAKQAAGLDGASELQLSRTRGDWVDARSLGYVQEWLRRDEARRQEAFMQSAAGTALRSAEAAEKSARWTLLAAIASLIAAVAALLQFCTKS